MCYHYKRFVSMAIAMVCSDSSKSKAQEKDIA